MILIMILKSDHRFLSIRIKDQWNIGMIDMCLRNEIIHPI